MNKLLLYFIVLLAASCSNTPAQEAATATLDTSATDSPSFIPDTAVNAVEVGMDTMATAIDDEIETYYVVIADTGYQYNSLRDQMLALHETLQQPIDTMRRTYNAAKNLITLPDNDEDEMYAGEYYPRRMPTTDLSLEYLDLYQDAAGEKSIALVTGIYEARKSADSAVHILRKTSPKAFVVKADLYMGCLH